MNRTRSDYPISLPQGYVRQRTVCPRTIALLHDELSWYDGLLQRQRVLFQQFFKALVCF
jgi:hypothetical protein